jgi:hypothetical protein
MSINTTMSRVRDIEAQIMNSDGETIKPWVSLRFWGYHHDCSTVFLNSREEILQLISKLEAVLHKLPEGDLQ